MKVLLNGYSGYAQLDGYDIMATSFSLSMSENVIKSDGAGKILMLDSNDEIHEHYFKRFGLNAVRDYPSYSLSVSFESTFDVFQYLLLRIRSGKLSNSFSVLFKDDAAGIVYYFDKAYFTSMSLDVSNNALAVVSMNFVMFKDYIEIAINNYNLYAKNYPPDNFIGAKMMPYWAWGVSYPGFNDGSLQGFSFSIEQQITPKFGCQGNLNDNALGPMIVVAGVPTVTYELNYILDEGIYVNNYGIPSNQVAMSGQSMVVKYSQSFTQLYMYPYTDSTQITFTNCYIDSYTPQIGNPGSANAITVSGTVYGQMFVENIRVSY